MSSDVILCPSPGCTEELGTQINLLPKFCQDCGAEIHLRCPKCSSTRGVTTKKTLAKFCSKCQYNFMAVDNPQTATSLQPAVIPQPTVIPQPAANPPPAADCDQTLDEQTTSLDVNGRSAGPLRGLLKRTDALSVNTMKAAVDSSGADDHTAGMFAQPQTVTSYGSQCHIDTRAVLMTHDLDLPVSQLSIEDVPNSQKRDKALSNIKHTTMESAAMVENSPPQVNKRKALTLEDSGLDNEKLSSPVQKSPKVGSSDGAESFAENQAPVTSRETAKECGKRPTVAPRISLLKQNDAEKFGWDPQSTSGHDLSPTNQTVTEIPQGQVATNSPIDANDEQIDAHRSNEMDEEHRESKEMLEETSNTQLLQPDAESQVFGTNSAVSGALAKSIPQKHDGVASSHEERSCSNNTASGTDEDSKPPESIRREIKPVQETHGDTDTPAHNTRASKRLTAEGHESVTSHQPEMKSTQISSGSDVRDAFMELKAKVHAAKGEWKRLTLDEMAVIDNAARELDKVMADHETHLKNENRTAHTSSQILFEDKNRMRNTFNRFAPKCTGVFAKLQIEQPTLLEQPKKLQKGKSKQQKDLGKNQDLKRSGAQPVTFHAVLSKEISKWAKKERLATTVTIMGAHAGQEWRRILELREVDGVWTGTTTLDLTHWYLRYKYYVHLSGHEHYEWMGKNSNGVIIDRILQHSDLGPSAQVFDGAIYPPEPSWIRETLKFLPSLLGMGTNQDDDLITGARAMLPSWMNSIVGGKTIHQLLDQVELVQRRQMDVMSKFSRNFENYGHGKDAEKLLHRLFKDYIKVCIEEHTEYLNSDDPSAVNLCASLLGILELVNRYGLVTKYAKYLAETIKKTIQKTTQLDIKSLHLQLNNKLCENSSFLSELSHHLANKIAVEFVSSGTQFVWICLLPLLHIITGVAQHSYEDDADFAHDNWWGVAGIKHLVDDIKKDRNATVGMWDVWLGWLKPFFPSMPMLPYTFIALLKEEQLVNLLEKFENKCSLPLNGILACVSHHLQERRRYLSSSSAKNGALAKLLLKYVNSTLSTERAQTTRATLDIAATSLQSIMPSYSHEFSPEEHAMFSFAQVYLRLMEACRRFDQQFHLQEKGRHLITFNDNLAKLVTSKFYSALGSTELKVWEALLKCSKVCTSDELIRWWNDVVKRTLVGRVSEVCKNHPKLVISLYCDNDFLPTLDEVIGDQALLVAEKILEKDSCTFRGHNHEKIGKLVQRAVSKQWKFDDTDRMAVVKNVIRWGSFLSLHKFIRELDIKFMNFIAAGSENLGDQQRVSIGEETLKRWVISCSAVEFILKTIINGTITFSDFTFFNEHREKLVSLCVVTESLNSHEKQRMLKQSFAQRLRQRHAFLHFHDDVKEFLAAFQPLLSGTEDIEKWLSRPVDKLTFRDIVDEDSAADTTVFIVCTELPDAVRVILDDFKKLKERAVFYELFISNLKKRGTLPLCDAAAVYGEILQEYNGIINSFKTGTISIAGLQKFLGRFFGNSKHHLIQELDHMIPDTDLTQRKRQIDICTDLKQYHEGATVILKFRSSFKLNGDFSAMDKILQSKDKTLQLKDIGDDLRQSAHVIKDITKRQRDSIHALLESKEFVDWAKESVKEKDISNFVDVAGSTLGEDDLAAQKTSSLLNALTGYSPLIYHLREDCDYKQFIEICTKVWKTLEEDSSLIKDLRASASELEWLKKVQDNFGNVEIDSIEQANAINTTGVYMVGRFREMENQQFKSVEDVIKLSCTVEGAKGKKKTKKDYSYAELKDLQSKLTLVAGDKQRENQETINKFNAMKDAVENLAKSFLVIRREGCIQFDELLAVIHCKPGREIGLELRLQSIGHVMHGKNKGGGRSVDALRHCHDVYTFLNERIDNWQEIMREKRRDNMELNFYTTEQLVVLRKELGVFLEKGTAACVPKALPLLAMIQPVSCSNLLQHIKSYTPSGDADVTSEPMESTNSFLSYADMDIKQRELVDTLMDEDEAFDEPKAVQAVNELGTDSELPEFFLWLEENSNTRPSSSVVDTQGSDLLTQDEVMKELLQDDLSNSPFLTQLKRLWDGFIEKTGQSIKNFLSIQHLVHVLSKLKGARFEKERELPTWLNRGKPRLIAVSEKHTYRLVLSIYEYDSACPCPTRNEVLICNELTRCEEARLFLDRALADPNSFYCMVNCHLLTYEVCRLIETRLSNTADDKVKDYGLAFIYAEERRDARIRAYLDKNIVKNCKLAEPDKLCDYVRKTLTLPLNITSADPDRSMARLIQSKRAGVGKSLQKNNLRVKLRAKARGKDVTIPIYRAVDTDNIINRLDRELPEAFIDTQSNMVHIDIAHEVESGVDELLFNLIILRSIVNSEGVVWQAQTSQYYIIECMPLLRKDQSCCHEVLTFLPAINCITPNQALEKYSKHERDFIGFDANTLMVREWQTVLKYLHAHKFNDATYKINREPYTDCQAALDLLIRNCGLSDPTWSELRHYVYFLSNQLFKVDGSPFCSQDWAADLPGFRTLVVQFMFRMAEDFATRSLKIAEETPHLNLTEVIEDRPDRLLDQLGVKRTWEKGNHPYLFFNEDGATFTPLGFHAQKEAGHAAFSLLDSQTGEVVLRDCISQNLKATLDRYKMSMSENFNSLSRQEQLSKLRNIMVKQVIMRTDVEQEDGSLVRVDRQMFVDGADPDENYVLTMDNAKKILAIHQRLRVNIPVIIMGETGCGKTKLIDFMSKLQVPTDLKEEITPMVIVKIHGGTSEEDIIQKVKKAEQLAESNQQKCVEYAERFDSSQVPKVYTILFLDEANTTEAIGLVKEILCDGRMRGEPLDRHSGLKIIAACNPYRRHTDAMIEKLKKAGLGYSVGEADTKDRFGQIPMRHLVYRVQPLSQSLLPLVWDFGSLKSSPERPANDVEKAYITKMVDKFNQTSGDEESPGLNFLNHSRLVAEVLSLTQSFMREQKDECSFVSLRDVQRALDVSNWFYKQREYLFPAMDRMLAEEEGEHEEDDDEEEMESYRHQFDYSTRSLILALGVCYLARLEDHTRTEYVRFLSPSIEELLGDEETDGRDFFMDQVERCQTLFINEVIKCGQHPNIAKNKALKENVFMMIVCIENRIPLFLVGKPGSSKSLSKAMVVDAMKGTSSHSDVLKRMKRTYMVSFQCSKHATPALIVGVFNHCANFQKSRDLNVFVSVVVLDEVGLAEDSENMPLKALHPLLEDGCEGNKTPEPYMKCAFVGISNWALDPAKMNRGIFVQRGTPQSDELAEIAREICKDSKHTTTKFIEPLAKSYLKICQAKKPDERDMTEFFGLRDFYSLMKMVTNFAKTTGRLNSNHLEHSIRRNFGGFDPDDFDPVKEFISLLPSLEIMEKQKDGKPPVDSIGLIKSSLSGVDTAVPGMESRYLLILTENLSVLSIILNEFATHSQQPEVVFGSRFRDDVSYTQVCHNLYRIKTCMAMGKPVILLNLDDLYESLYDALNQYFSTWGDRKFVDIGLGTHRVKAFVNDKFRLVVIADKNKVHTQFPIPLINRLEKHYVSATSFLLPDEKQIKQKLEDWAQQFVRPSHFHRNVCTDDCQSCSEVLTQPYRLPCQHYIGHCCLSVARDSRRCPVTGCDEEIAPDFEWSVNVAALENRQYFENCSVEKAFIGYSTEATALAVQQAVDEMKKSLQDPGPDTHQQVLTRAKYCLLQCATGEAVLRLDKTVLRHEAVAIQGMYLRDQHHETLLQYLRFELGNRGHNSHFIQATSFAELMSSKDVAQLTAGLRSDMDVATVNNVYLKDFVKEDHFTKKLRSCYEQHCDSEGIRLLLVQCESADENMELLDSVRYIIKRESEAAKKRTHTVLMLSVPRGRTFTGYQGGEWRCVHIDDPKSPDLRLPSVHECLSNTPSQILGYLVNAVADEMEDDEPPPLEDECAEMEEYPDYEMIETKAHITVRHSDELTDDLHKFIIQSLPRAVSVIKSQQHTSGHTDRLQLIKKLLADGQGEFTKLFLKHAHALLSAQDEHRVVNWVKADAAKASNMKESETLRHALEDSLERAFVPALAAIIAFTDVRENLQLLNSNSPFVPLWMEIFSQSDKLGLTFENLTKRNESASSKLPDSYKVQQVGKGRQQFQVSCPFSWLIKDEIDKIIAASSEAHIPADAEMLIGQFNQTPIGRIIGGVGEITLYEQLLKAFVADYVYMTHPCMSSSEHWIVVDSIMKVMRRECGIAGRLSLVHVRLAFDFLEEKCEHLSAILELSAKYGDLPAQLITSLKQDNSSEEILKPFDLLALSHLLGSISKISLPDLQKNSDGWVLEVDMCKMIVSHVMASYKQDEDCEHLQQQCQEKWLLLVVKKLYVLNVIVPTKTGADGKKKSFKLAFFLRTVKNTNFHSWEAFNQVVEALQKSVAESICLLYPKCPKRCPGCQQSLDSPVPLPCKHFLCDTCARNLTLCPEERCGREIPDDDEYTPAASDINQEKVAEFKALRGRLNRFFMSFVSELVFGSEQDPEDKVIRWLLNCITYGTAHTTRQFSLFNSSDVIDPTPVLRSFLLKLLLQCNQTDSVTHHLNTILSQWTADRTHQIQTFVLFIDCWKDIHSRDLHREQGDLVRRLQEMAGRVLSGPRTIDVDILMDVAIAQSTISQLVTLLFKDDSNNPHVMGEVGRCLREMLDISRGAGNPQPSYLIARQIFKEHGEAQLKDLLNTPLNFLIPDAVKQDLESFTVPDVLSVYGGQHYQDIKVALDEFIVESGSADGIANAVNQLKELVNNQETGHLMQVLFTRVTRTVGQNTPVSEDIRNELLQQLAPLVQPQQQTLLRMLLQTELLPQEMDLSNSRGLQLSMLILHTYTCLAGPANTQPFLRPLAEIVSQPLQAANHFLPTMADSQLETQMNSIRNIMPGENPSVYKCAKSHIYVIGNCGRPVESATCKEPGCGAPIGSTGAYDKAAAGTVKIDENNSEFKSKPGHILGPSTDRPGPHSERKLNTLSCAVLRCLTHLCMYTASLLNNQQLMSVIHPTLASDDQVQPFIDAHIHLDIRHISHCCSLSPDDCMLLVHEVIASMCTDNRGGQAIAALTTIQQRSQWEQEFDTLYIKPTFTGDLALKVQTIRDKLRTADSVDVRRLLSTHDKPVNDRNILASAGLWSYRQPLTLPALQNLLHIDQKGANLTKLVDQCERLVAVTYLPDIVQLLKLFDNEFHSSFSRPQASSTRIDHFWQKHRDTTPQLKQLIDSFICAWNIFLKYSTGEEELVKLNWRSPVGMFLHDAHANQETGTTSIGTAAYQLVEFLTAAHNSMFFDDPDRPVIALAAVNSSNIVSVSGDEEILSMVECQSEYEIKGETKVEYNWQAIEREVLHRYIGNKPKINLTRDQLPSFVFQEDFNLHNQMEAIDSSQRCMTRAQQASVVRLLPPRIPKLKEYLKDLEILINFMSRQSYIEGDSSLSEYMETTFVKRTDYMSKEIKLKHIKHVWLAIKYTQTDLLMRQHQEPFGDTDPKYTDIIDHQLSDALKRVCTFNSPKTKVLLEELFKYIVLRLNKPAVKQRPEEPEQILQENLTSFIQFTTNEEDEDRVYGLLEELPALPAELHVKHASNAWRYIWTRYTTPTE